MPKVKDIFSKLNGVQYFSTLDLWVGYHHIPLNNASIPDIAFTSHIGKYEYLNVPFWVAQAPANFQKPMNKVLKDLPFRTAYLDDIIIYRKTMENIWITYSKFSTNSKMQSCPWNWANTTSLPKKFNIRTTSSAQYKRPTIKNIGY